MSRRNNTADSSGRSVVRLFVWTAIVAIVLSIGVIVGQHLLVQDGMPPAISTADDAPSLASSPDDSDTPGADDEDEGPNLYSFYDALTGDQAREAADDRLDEAGDTPEAGDEPVGDSPGAAADVVADDEDGVDEDDDSAAARYTLQVASHPTIERARIEMDRLKALDLEPQLVTDEASDGQQLYRVRIGKFPSEDEARAHRNRLENNHDVEPLITSL